MVTSKNWQNLRLCTAESLECAQEQLASYLLYQYEATREASCCRERHGGGGSKESSHDRPSRPERCRRVRRDHGRVRTRGSSIAALSNDHIVGEQDSCKLPFQRATQTCPAI